MDQPNPSYQYAIRPMPDFLKEELKKQHAQEPPPPVPLNRSSTANQLLRSNVGQPQKPGSTGNVAPPMSPMPPMPPMNPQNFRPGFSAQNPVAGFNAQNVGPVFSAQNPGHGFNAQNPFPVLNPQNPGPAVNAPISGFAFNAPNSGPAINPPNPAYAFNAPNPVISTIFPENQYQAGMQKNWLAAPYQNPQPANALQGGYNRPQFPGNIPAPRAPPQQFPPNPLPYSQMFPQSNLRSQLPPNPPVVPPQNQFQPPWQGNVQIMPPSPLKVPFNPPINPGQGMPPPQIQALAPAQVKLGAGPHLPQQVPKNMLATVQENFVVSIHAPENKPPPTTNCTFCNNQVLEAFIYEKGCPGGICKVCISCVNQEYIRSQHPQCPSCQRPYSKNELLDIHENLTYSDEYYSQVPAEVKIPKPHENEQPCVFGHDSADIIADVCPNGHIVCRHHYQTEPKCCACGVVLGSHLNPQLYNEGYE